MKTFRIRADKKINNEKKPSYNDEQFQLACDVNIVDYLLANAYELRKKGREFCLQEHDSLVINREKNNFYWHSKAVGGGSIQFIQEFLSLDWVSAILELCNFAGLSLESVDISQVKPIHKASKQKNQFNYDDFRIPDKANNNKRVFAYLHHSRKIHPHVINYAIKHDLLYQDTYGNCTFLGKKKNGEVHFASLRGSNASRRFMIDIPCSNKEVGFKIINNPDNNKVYVFESPIDVLSFMSLLKLYNQDFQDYNFLSLGGLQDLALQSFLDDYESFTDICFCLDNDRDGRLNNQPYNHGQIALLTLVKKYMEKGYICTRHIPNNKDYNDDLIEFLEKKEKENIEEAFEMEV